MLFVISIILHHVTTFLGHIPTHQFICWLAWFTRQLIFSPLEHTTMEIQLCHTCWVRVKFYPFTHFLTAIHSAPELSPRLKKLSKKSESAAWKYKVLASYPCKNLNLLMAEFWENWFWKFWFITPHHIQILHLHTKK